MDEGAAGTLGSEMTEDTESETTENTEQDQHGDGGTESQRGQVASALHSRRPKAGTRRAPAMVP